MRGAATMPGEQLRVQERKSCVEVHHQEPWDVGEGEVQGEELGLRPVVQEVQRRQGQPGATTVQEL